jgi:hypothetical protein
MAEQIDPVCGMTVEPESDASTRQQAKLRSENDQLGSGFRSADPMFLKQHVSVGYRIGYKTAPHYQL